MGSPAFLGGVSPSFQGSPAPVNLFHSYSHFGDQSFDPDVLSKEASNKGKNKLDEFIKYDFSLPTNNLMKTEKKKSLNEQDNGRLDNYDSVGSSSGVSTGAEVLDTTRDTSTSNSRKSSIDMSGSQGSLPELMRSYPQQTGLPQTQQSLPSHQSIPSQVNPAAFNPFMANHFPPFSAMPPFGNFQSFPMTSTSQQIPYPQNTVAGQYHGNMNPYAIPGYLSGQPDGSHPGTTMNPPHSSASIPNPPSSGVACTSLPTPPVQVTSSIPNTIPANPPLSQQQQSGLSNNNG